MTVAAKDPRSPHDDGRITADRPTLQRTARPTTAVPDLAERAVLRARDPSETEQSPSTALNGTLGRPPDTRDIPRLNTRQRTAGYHHADDHHTRTTTGPAQHLGGRRPQDALREGPLESAPGRPPAAGTKRGISRSDTPRTTRSVFDPRATALLRIKGRTRARKSH